LARLTIPAVCGSRALTVLTGALLRPFVWLDARVPAVRRHGYLLASVGVKPGDAATWHRTAHPHDAVAGLAHPVPAGDAAPAAVQTGIEYVIDVRGCEPEALRSLPRLQGLFAAVIADVGLQPVAPSVWHVFAGQNGITGMVLLSESHLTIHTYPESGVAAVNLYCCRRSAEWPWDEQVRVLLGARDVSVRAFRRG
jgi:S-adenosylmethionine decarboxylase